jgi:lipopolysaccharide biosynthesis protein
MGMNTNIKSIAYYLPQFHRIPENDEWWGEGFTEWTNVKKAKPLFKGHEQPKIPYEYYDLSNPTIMHNQISMAKKYGLYGFCFYYYWFSGKRLLENPVENFLKDESEESNFPFMICWANENWSRRWNGKDQDVLIRQEYQENDHHLLSLDFIRHFKDDRYIKDDGYPVLMIYRPNVVNDFGQLIKVIREQTKQAGFPGVKILCSETYGFKNSENYDIDGMIQFPPNFTFCDKPRRIGRRPNRFDYTATVEKSINLYHDFSHENCESSIKVFYPCSFPSWDNTARRGKAGTVFVNCNIEQFERWLSASKDFTIKYNQKSENFIFINAWNEWAEGAYLEPDETHGFARLEAIRKLTDNIE